MYLIVGFRAKFYALSVAKSVFSYLLYIFSNKALFTDWCTFIFPSNCHRYHISPLSYRILRPIYHFGVIVQSAFYLGIPVCKIHNGKERLQNTQRKSNCWKLALSIQVFEVGLSGAVNGGMLGGTFVYLQGIFR